MRDVQLAPAQARIAGGGERRAHHNDRQSKPDQGVAQIALGPKAPYGAMIRGQTLLHAHVLHDTSVGGGNLGGCCARA